MAAKITKDYGRFSRDGKSFTINDIRLPGVWEHYLSNGLYCLVLSQTWCGYSFVRSRTLYPVSIGGRLAFIRDEDTGDVWPVNEMPPGLGQAQSYEQLHGLTGDQSTGPARFRVPLEAPAFKKLPIEKQKQPIGAITSEWGMGYAAMTSRHGDVEVRMTLRIAPSDPVELWDITVRNLGKKTRRLAVMPATSFHLGAGIQMAGNATVCTFTDLDHRNQTLWARMEGIRKPCIDNIVGFMAATGWRADGLFGTLDSAQAALLDPDAQEAAAFGEEAVALLRMPVDLKPGQEKSLNLLVGTALTIREGRKLIRKFKAAKPRKQASRSVADYWEDVFASQRIQTPDEELNRFYNSWLKYEMVQVARWCRGEGRGYRDTLQDSEGIGLLDADYARGLIEMCLVRQRADGWCVREFDETLPGQTSTRDFRDSGVWIAYALDSYLRETGDLAFLGKRLPYLDTRERRSPDRPDEKNRQSGDWRSQGTVFEHACRACEFLMKNRGAHGLPLIAGGDWNDALDRVGIGGKGESVWLAIALHRSIKLVEGLLTATRERAGSSHALDARRTSAANDAAENLRALRASRLAASRLAAWAAELERAIDSAGWDGKWYRRAFDDNGRAIGSSRCKQGRIFLLPQAWAAFSGLHDRAKVEQAMASADRLLQSEWGPPKLWPGYTKRDLNIGRITARAAGLGENAGIHTHAVTFKIKADLALGRGDLAYRTLQKVAPIAGHGRGLAPAEPPYTLCNQRVGPENPEFGAHKNRWLSGSVSWIFRLITEDMLGAKAEIGGLRIDPCLPSDWTRARIERTFRGALYEIDLRKPKGVQHGKVRLKVDGQAIDGNLIPPRKPGRYAVEAVILDERG